MEDSAGLNFLEVGAAFIPMASKSGRNAMFGEEAMAQTSKTVNTIADIERSSLVWH
jgi:hypothetical protein